LDTPLHSGALRRSMKAYMIERLTEMLLEDEALTDGLTDQDASELLNWLIGMLEDLEAELGEEPQRHQQYVAHLRRLGHEITHISRSYGVPVEELIDLIELAWREPGEELSQKPMRA